MPTRRKWLYVLCKAGIMLAVIAMGIIAVFASGLELPTVESTIIVLCRYCMIALVANTCINKQNQDTNQD